MYKCKYVKFLLKDNFFNTVGFFIEKFTKKFTTMNFDPCQVK